MNTPEHYLDPPDSCDPAPDPEVTRLKEDVRALKGLLALCNAQITTLVQWADRAYVDQKPIRDLRQLQDRIDAELNG